MGAGGKGRKTGAIAGLLFLGAALALTGCNLGGADLPYTITVEQPYITASKTLAVPGDTIVLTVAPGFTPGNLWYNDGADHVIAFNGSTGSFIMPAANVKVGAAFASTIPASRPPGSFSLSPPLAEAFAYINSNAVGGDEYTIIMDRDESLDPVLLLPSWAYGGITVTLMGDGIERHVNLNSRGPLFTTGGGVTFILDEGITLHGRADNNTALVHVSGGSGAVMADSGVLVPTGGGGLVMNNGVKITGNRGGGVELHDGASFTMTGGAISDNNSDIYGGGVCFFDGGDFIMSGGTISGNTASSGGGVYLSKGTFTMSGGAISGNTASSGGGGVTFQSDGNFTMNGGTISGNTASGIGGGGIAFSGGGDFTMSGGTISGNTTIYDGGGVSVYSGDFTMNGGTISNNASNGEGGGVAFYGGTFTINGGAISDNTANGGAISSNTASSGSGGGVSFYSNGTFTMSGGTVSGNTASNGPGGGVAFFGGGNFTMREGTISGNTALNSGGVFLSDGNFTMSGGTISGNTALSNGGGVFIYNNSTFRKAASGGVIYGSDALGLDSSGRPLKNTAGYGVGHAVYLGGSSDKRDTTAGVGIMLDSTISGAPGGWE